MLNSRYYFVGFVIFLFIQQSSAQNLLSTNGRAIVNENQDTILLRGMGLGGWMVQEGYMLQTASFASPQHEIRATIQDLIGEADTEVFYEAWLNNHVRKSDIDSLKSWGFNSVRLPMHYNLFTLPIEDEPVEGEDTWLDKGFELTDQLVEWCRSNEMYVILDMHAAPGGQGYDAAISDYDSTKPSLWESAENRRKLVALWTRIAEHYSDEEWIAGYDLLNETNWDLPGGNALRTIYQNITSSIREVDPNHIVFLEGNWFANDFTGLTPPWDDNLVYSPHKYWSTNDEATMQWVIDLRNAHNVPLYLGESGENSNVWFRDAIHLLEGLDIGWAWWPMKKVESISGPLSIIKTPEYQSLLDYWNGNGPQPTAEFARATLMDLTEKLKTENCIYQKDVIDAMIRQVQSNETLPFKSHNIPGVIHAADYDLGVIGEAYYDIQTGNYQVSTGEFTSWNDGWQYRNDGVDIEVTTNTLNSNGYNVGFMDAGEWMQYEVNVEEAGVYEIHVRTSSGGSGGLFHFAMDGADLMDRTFAGPTGGWQNWQTVIVPNVILNEGNQKLRFHTDIAGYNLASFEFVKTDLNSEDLFNVFISAETKDEMTIQVSVNKLIGNMTLTPFSSFEVEIDGEVVSVTNVTVDPNNSRLLNLRVDHLMNSTDEIKVSYTGQHIVANDGSALLNFDLEEVKNTLEFVHQLPGKVEAEDFFFQTGVELEDCTDIGGGMNIGFLDPGDYLDYDVNVTSAGTYEVDFRTAAEFGSGRVNLQLIDDGGDILELSSVPFTSTGGWQTWTTTSASINIPLAGRFILRVLIVQSPFNMNWMNFKMSTSAIDLSSDILSFDVYPNPSLEDITVRSVLSKKQNVELILLDLNGRVILHEYIKDATEISKMITMDNTYQGVYILQLRMEDGSMVSRRVVKL